MFRRDGRLKKVSRVCCPSIRVRHSNMTPASKWPDFSTWGEWLFYTRLQNPTNDAVAAKIAAGRWCGMLCLRRADKANFYAIFNICQAGDHFVCSSSIYGGTFNLFAVTLKKLGIEVTFWVLMLRMRRLRKLFRLTQKALFGESISKPL